MTMSEYDFKIQNKIEDRVKMSTNILYKYSYKIPVIIEKKNSDKSRHILDKNKYIMSSDLTLGSVIYIIRKRLNLNPNEAIFIFVDNVLLPNTMVISDIYRQYKDPDGFLYIMYACENTFG